MKSIRHLSILAGTIAGLIFGYLAVRKVDLDQLWEAFRNASLWPILIAVAVLMACHAMRALRWRYFLGSLEPVGLGTLFSAVMMGYMGNVIMPAHLGDVMRSFSLSRKCGIAMSLVMGTIVLERIVDMFSLLAIMLLTLFVQPFPDFVKQSGIVMFLAVSGVLVTICAIKVFSGGSTLNDIRFMKVLPKSLRYKVSGLFDGFFQGFVLFRSGRHYFMAAILTILMWTGYVLVFQLCLLAMGSMDTYNLKWQTSLTLLVITTIGIIVPSSPGYIGTYHYLCQVALALYSVPASLALSYAVVVHGVNFLPVLLIGLSLFCYEGVRCYSAERTT
jgi:glycosyltransferase 2 family protein